MDHRTRHRRRPTTDSAFRGVRFAAAAIALALIACGAGGEGSGAEEARAAEDPLAAGREAAGNGARPPGSAESAPAGNAAENGAADGGAAADHAAATNGREERPVPGNGSAETRAITRMAMRPPPSPPPDPADPVRDAPPPPLPETPDLSSEEAIERACDPPVGPEVRSLTTCGAVARAYQGLMERNRACRRDEDCRIIEGSCEIGLGGCWYAVNREVGYADADALAARYRDLACSGPVCRCAPPPERARCRQGVCAAG